LAVSRKLRIEYPGAMYHVMNRGDQRDNIFLSEVVIQNNALGTVAARPGNTDIGTA
jgi:hypothetical protein